MKSIYAFLILGFFASCSSQSKSTTSISTSSSTSTSNEPKSFYDLSVTAIDDSSAINMASFKGKKVLIVNVASRCGYTPQYKGLQELHATLGDQVQIIGFPCNQFMGQEPGTNDTIASFCSRNFGVTFPLTTKINVKGNDQHSVYKWLTSKDLNGKSDYKVSWNFNKFLIDEKGNLVGHYESKVKPMSPELVTAIKK